jgi:hypothetical protein
LGFNVCAKIVKASFFIPPAESRKQIIELGIETHNMVTNGRESLRNLSFYY